MANSCPFCDAAPCLPLWRKLTLGPAVSAQCRTCGLKVTVEAGRAWIAMVPILLLVAATVTHLVVTPAVLLSLLVVCIALSCGLYVRWVRLVPGQITSAAMLDEARRKKG